MTYVFLDFKIIIFVQVKMALQLNVKIEKSDGMEYIFKNLSTIYFPVLWFETSVELPGSMASALQLLVNIPMIMVIASIIGILAGFIGIVVVLRKIVKEEAQLGEQEMMSGFRPWQGKMTFIKNILTFKNDKNEKLSDCSE